MKKRDMLLHSIRIAAAKGDEKGAMEIYVENRIIGYQAFIKEFRKGKAMRSKTEHVQNLHTCSPVSILEITAKEPNHV